MARKEYPLTIHYADGTRKTLPAQRWYENDVMYSILGYDSLAVETFIIMFSDGVCRWAVCIMNGERSDYKNMLSWVGAGDDFRPFTRVVGTIAVIIPDRKPRSAWNLLIPYYPACDSPNDRSGPSARPGGNTASAARNTAMQIIHGNSIDVLATLEANTIDSLIGDTPYHLSSVRRIAGATFDEAKEGACARYSRGFGNKEWDGDIAFYPEFWRTAYRVLKPGAHLLLMGATRTHHKLWTAVEAAGFELLDMIDWVYGSGMPKSKNIALMIDKAMGHPNRGRRFTIMNQPNGERLPPYIPQSPEAQAWAGWNTSLKPAHEPILLARKPLDGTIAHNFLKWGVGGINIDACRTDTGRWPANLIHDGSEEVVRLFPDDRPGCKSPSSARPSGTVFSGSRAQGAIYADDGSAERFFYCAKPSRVERDFGLPENGNFHMTVKPLALMRYLVKLITPVGGTVLDPFLGSGTTGMAAVMQGFGFIGIELMEEYVEIARKRIAAVMPAKTVNRAG